MHDRSTAGDVTAIARHFDRLLGEYPAEAAVWIRSHRERFLHDAGLLADRVERGGSVCDIGGGYSALSFLLAALGFAVTVVDDFRDWWHEDVWDSMQAMFARHGVRVERRDVADGAALRGERYDAITLLHIIEHFHHSPRALLHAARDALAPGGLLIVATPNSVNLRKRLSVPLGVGKWSALSDWYGQESFRGHVREPDTDDLLRIGEDLGLESSRILGRNFFGMQSRFPVVRRLARVGDPVLRMFPSLCSDLYLLGNAGDGRARDASDPGLATGS